MKTTLNPPGMTLAQIARHEFTTALIKYRSALISGDSAAIIETAARAWGARTRKTDRTAINRAYKEAMIERATHIQSPVGR